MQMDRDLGVAVAETLHRRGVRDLQGWEMLAATGARGLRLVNETDLFREMWLTESNSRAFAVLEENTNRYAARGARPVQWDARKPIRTHSFDFIDLDPFGSPAPFLLAALESAKDTSVVAVTATDLRVLTGAQRGVCETQYGARPLRGRLGPEGGLRVILALLSRAARSQGRRIRPMLSYIRDYYVRTYVALTVGVPGETEAVESVDTAAWRGPPLLAQGAIGPLWTGPLFDSEFVAHLENPVRSERPAEVSAFLERLKEECKVDVPFYFEPNTIASTFRLKNPPPLKPLLEHLRDKGYPAVRAHPRPAAFRTTAPAEIVAAVARDLTTERRHSQNDRVRA